MDHHDERTKVVPVVVVMVPFISHGHLNQLILLSNIVTTYHIPVHLVCTATSLTQARTRLDSVLLATNHMINFHEFTTPPFASSPPDPSVAFPAHQQPSFESTLHLRQHVGDLVILLSKTAAARVVVIHDTLMSYVVQDVVSIPNVETYNFRPLSAFYYFWDFWDKLGKPFEVDDMIYNKLPSKDGIVTPEFKAFARLQYPHMNNVVGDLYDSSRVIEGEYIDYLERQEISGKKKIWAIGPINPVQIEESTDVKKNRHHCLRWLDEQSKNSVIYVSFGTTTTFSKDQIRELAIGLEKSGKRFIWVVRAADVGRFQDELVKLPDGFEERVKGRGLIERGWAPQLEILGHFATGGFLSHCGWNSCMESMSMGVPMATWPMHSDQPRNAVLITQVLGIGVVVKDWEPRDELVRDVVVKEAVEKLMGSKEGDEMRKSAAMLGDSIKKSMMEAVTERPTPDKGYLSKARQVLLYGEPDPELRFVPSLRPADSSNRSTSLPPPLTYEQSKAKAAIRRARLAAAKAEIEARSARAIAAARETRIKLYWEYRSNNKASEAAATSTEGQAQAGGPVPKSVCEDPNPCAADLIKSTSTLSI